jgi:hypothetical protein
MDDNKTAPVGALGGQNIPALPWVIERDGRAEFGIVIGAPKDFGDVCYRVATEETASLIVRAVNSHDELVAALKCASTILSLLDKEVKALGFNAKNVPEMVRSALSRATGA